MPKIPQTISTRSPSATPRPVSLLRVSPEAAKRSVAEPAELSAQFIKETSENIVFVAEKFQQAKNLQETSSAQVEAKKKILDLEMDAEESQDVWNIEDKFAEGMATVREETSNLVSDPESRLRFQTQFDLDAATKSYNVRRLARTKQLDVSRATMLDNLTELEKDYVNSASPQERKMTLDKINALIDNNVQLGIIAADKGAELKETLKIDLPITDAKNMMAIDPTLAREMLNQKKFGIADPTEREKLIKDAATLEKRNIEEAQWQLNLDNNALEQQVAKDIISGQVDNIKDLDDLEATGHVFQPGYRAAAEKLIKSFKKIDPNMKARAFNEIVDDFYKLDISSTDKSSASLKDFAKYRIKLMDMLSEGLITQGVYNTQVNKIESSFNDKLRDFADRGVELEKTTFDFFNLWTEIHIDKDQRDDAAMFLKQELIQYMQNNPTTPKDDIPVIANRILGRYMGVSTDVKDKGTELIDSQGNRALMFPDGRYHEIDPATGAFGPLRNSDGTLFKFGG